jgi:hypothetical protein
MLPAQAPLALESLGWSSFQDLAVAYAEDVLQTRLITYAKSRDLGADAQQSLFTADEVPHLVVQAKHTSTQEPMTLGRFAPELEKLPALVAAGCGRYLLVTNHVVTGETAAALKTAAKTVGCRDFEVHGRDEVVRRIRESATLRAMVPRLYGIGDLSQILDARVIEQTQALLAASRPDLERFVATDAYRESVRALDAHGIIALLGEPAAGKSTIARALSVTSIDAYGATPIVLPSLSQLEAHWNPLEPRRLYWIDDVFGATQVRFGAADDFNRLTPLLRAALAQGSKFVLTSRTYIWRGVVNQLKLSATPGLQSGIVEIKVEDYAARDRAQIVYNHIKHGDQSAEWRRRFKTWAPQVAAHPRFSPEVARRFGLAAFAGGLAATPEAVDRFVRNPARLLEEVIGGLAPSGQAALALILMSGGSLPIHDPPSEVRDLVCNAYGVSPADVLHQLEAMEGDFSARAVAEGEPVWRFRHPTIGEAVATVAAGSAPLLDIYLKGADLHRILDEVVCAGVTVEGAIIQVGASRFEALVSRMTDPSRYLDPRLVRRFLLKRATPAFRRAYFREPIAFRHPLLSWDWDQRAQTLALLAQLQTEGLVGETCLLAVRKRISDGLLSHGVADYLSGWARDLLGADELDSTLEAVVDALRDGGADYIEYWTPSGDERRESSPHDAFRGLTDFVERLEELVDPEVVAEVLETIQERINERADEIQAELDDEDTYNRERDSYYRDHPPSERRAAAEPPRSSSLRAGFGSPTEQRASIADIFSDVDE